MLALERIESTITQSEEIVLTNLLLLSSWTSSGQESLAEEKE